MVENINTCYWEIFCTLENSIYFCAIKRTFIDTLLCVKYLVYSDLCIKLNKTLCITYFSPPVYLLG